MEVSAEKTCDFCIIGDSRRENACFSLQWGICKEKTRDFRINGGFSKRKGVIFASMGDLQRENARFSG